MKDLQEDNLFGSIRKRLGRYEEAPSEELWGKIASRKRERVWPMFLEPVGVAIVGMILLFSNPTDVKIENVSPKESVVTEEGQVSNIKYPTTNNQQPIPNNQITDHKTEGEQLITNNQQPITRSQIEPQQQTTNNKLQTKPDSVASSPIITKKDSSFVAEKTPIEVVPPYKKPKSRFQIFISVTPSLSFQKMIPSADDDIIIEGFENRSPLSIKRFGFGIDAGFQKDINRLFGFYGGASFYRQHQELTYNYYERDAQVTRVDDSWTFEINRPRHSRSFDYSMTNVGVRSGILLTVKGEKLKHKVGAGLTYSYNFRKASYVSYQLLYRNELMINDRLSWFIEPTFIYSFISKEKLDEPFTLKPYRAGMTTGLLYKF